MCINTSTLEPPGFSEPMNNSRRIRYKTEEEQEIQNQLNEFDKKYNQEAEFDNLLDKLPDGDSRDPNYANEFASGSRHDEKIDLDDLGLYSKEFGAAKLNRKSDESGSTKKQTGKISQMNNPLAALVMSLNIEEKSEPISTSYRKKSDDLDALIALNHNRDRRTQGLSSNEVGGLDAINQLLEGFQIQPLTDPTLLMKKSQTDFKEEKIQAEISHSHHQSSQTTLLDAGNNSHQVYDNHKNQSKHPNKMVNSIIDVVGKPISLVKNIISALKDAHTDNENQHIQLSDQPVLKTLRIDELITKQKKQAYSDNGGNFNRSQDPSKISIQEIVDILPKAPRILAFDDTWVSEVKAYLTQNEAGYQYIKIDKDSVTMQASNKLLGISDPIDILSSQTQNNQTQNSKLTTTSVLKLDGVTSNTSISNAVSQQLTFHLQDVTDDNTVYKLLLEAFAAEEKTRLKVSKKRRSTISLIRGLQLSGNSSLKSSWNTSSLSQGQSTTDTGKQTNYPKSCQSIFDLKSFPSLSSRSAANLENCTQITHRTGESLSMVLRAENTLSTVRELAKTVKQKAMCVFAVTSDLMHVAYVDGTGRELVLVDVAKAKIYRDKLPSNSVTNVAAVGGVCSVDVAAGGAYWAAGFTSGEVLVKKGGGGWAQKKCRLDEGVIDASVGGTGASHLGIQGQKPTKHVTVRFIGDDILLAASETILWKIVIKDLKVVLDLTKSQVWRCTMEELEICDIRPIMSKGSWNVAISTLPGTIRLLSCGQTFTELVKISRPDGVESDNVPNLGILDTQEVSFNLIVVFWDTKIILVTQEGSTFCILKIVESPGGKKILDGHVIKGYLISMILDDYSIHVGSLPSVFGLDFETIDGEVIGQTVGSLVKAPEECERVHPWAGLATTYQLDKYQLAKPRQVGFRFDGSQTFCLSEICRVSLNYLCFLTYDGPISLKLAGPADVAILYAEHGFWLSAFKLCVFVCTKAIKVPKPEQEAAKLAITELSLQITSRHPPCLYNQQEEDWKNQIIIDKSTKIEHQIARLCIDALMNSENSEFLLNEFRQKTDELVLWQMLDLYIQVGQVEKIPVDAYPTALKYLTAESAEFLIFQTCRQSLLAHTDKLSQIMKILWYRKLWGCVYRLGLLVFEDTLYSIFNTLLGECKGTLLIEGQSQLANLVEKAITSEPALISQVWQADKAFEDYLRLIWFLRTLCSWDVSNIIEDLSRVEITLNYVIAWMVLPSNLKLLDSLQLNIYLEILHDLFTNVDFSSNPKAFELVRRNVEPFKTRLIPIMGAPNSKPQITIPEGTEGLKLKMFLLFKLLEDILFEHCHISHRVEISFFAVELILLSVFGKHPFNDTKFIQNLLVNLLSAQFTPGRLWHRFIKVSKEEFEEKVTKFVSRLQEHQAFEDCQETLLWLARENKHLRVLGYLLEAVKGPVEALPVYIELSHESPSTSNNMLVWMKKKLSELHNKPALKLEMAKQIFRHIDSIVSCKLTHSDKKEQTNSEGDHSATTKFRR